MQGPVRSGGLGIIHKNFKAGLDLEKVKIQAGNVLDKAKWIYVT